MTTLNSFCETYPEFYFVENCARRQKKKTNLASWVFSGTSVTIVTYCIWPVFLSTSLWLSIFAACCQSECTVFCSCTSRLHRSACDCNSCAHSLCSLVCRSWLLKARHSGCNWSLLRDWNVTWDWSALGVRVGVGCIGHVPIIKSLLMMGRVGTGRGLLSQTDRATFCCLFPLRRQKRRPS